MTERDAAIIRKALTELPLLCKYHGDPTPLDGDIYRREACCDTGVGAKRRRDAEAALLRAVKEAR